MLCRFFEYSVNSIKKSLTTRHRGDPLMWILKTEYAVIRKSWRQDHVTHRQERGFHASLPTRYRRGDEPPPVCRQQYRKKEPVRWARITIAWRLSTVIMRPYTLLSGVCITRFVIANRVGHARYQDRLRRSLAPLRPPDTSMQGQQPILRFYAGSAAAFI